ncbi:MAG: hypothetical protein VB674_06845 [Vicinamibacterales bacterium]
MTDQSPKSAYEVAMEKLKAQDEASGSVATDLGSEQIEAISAARQDYEAKLAECKILHQSKMASTFDPAAREELEARYRRDLSHFEADREKKIDRIRRGDG